MELSSLAEEIAKTLSRVTRLEYVSHNATYAGSQNVLDS